MKIGFSILILVGIVIGLLAFFLPSILKIRGLHPDYKYSQKYNLPGKKALIIATNQATLNKPGEKEGKATGVFASEMTVPYYEFSDAGMEVDVASINGGEIPIDPISFYYFIKSDADKRYLKDDVFKNKVENSLAIDGLDFSNYDVIFFAGGWGAAYDLGYSEELGEKLSQVYYSDKTIFGAVCHGVLGFIKMKDRVGNSLISNRRMTGVTDKQIEELGLLETTPMHPESELKKLNVKFESNTASKDVFANLVVIDDEKRFVTGQNQNAGSETAQKIMELTTEIGEE